MGVSRRSTRFVGFGLAGEGVQVRHCRQPVSLSMGKRSPKIRRSRIDLGRPSVQDQVMRGGAGGGVCATVQREMFYMAKRYRGINPPERENRRSHSQQA